MSLVVWAGIVAIALLIIVGIAMVMLKKHKKVSGSASSPSRVPKMRMNAFGA